jgi:hypothetical protein
MATETRLYHVIDEITREDVMVEATLPSQARSIVVKDRFSATPVSAIECARLTARGVKTIWLKDSETADEPEAVAP